LGWSLLVLW